VHSFEAGRRGKPDELDGGIAHLIGAYFLGLDSNSRFDLRVSGGYLLDEDKPVVRLSGEVSGYLLEKKNIREEITEIVLEHYNKVHKTSLSPDEIKIEFEFKPQADALALNGNSGDSGNAIAVAYADGPKYLPWERFLTVRIRDIIDSIYQGNGKVPKSIAEETGIEKLEGLRADGKVEVDAVYLGAELKGIKNITIAIEHEKSLPVEELRDKTKSIISAHLAILEKEYRISFRNPNIVINANGAWNIGGWKADEGSREAKPYRDGFATYGVNEDSFSGEDPSKPSGTGTFLARYIAVQIVKRGMADFARVGLIYTIGGGEVELNVTTNWTGKLSQDEIENWVMENIPLSINGAIRAFGLRDAGLYRRIVEGSDFFHDPILPWNGETLDPGRYKHLASSQAYGSKGPQELRLTREGGNR